MKTCVVSDFSRTCGLCVNAVRLKPGATFGSRDTEASTRARSSDGGSVCGTARARASVTLDSARTSAAHEAHDARCASNAARSAAVNAPSA